MVTALIFAGGTGKRMNARSKPKQFLEMHGKPIIIYTLEHFEYHPLVDRILIVCLENWIPELNGMLQRYGISKAERVIPGGETGHESIYLGLQSMRDFAEEDEIVLIHDGVRPLINEELITKNIESVRAYGSAITAEPARESVIRSADGLSVSEVPNRGEMYVAKAPQSFYFKQIFDLYERAHRDGIGSIDSAHLCSIYDTPMHMVESTPNNVKITDPADFYIFRAVYEALEGQQIYGI